MKYLSILLLLSAGVCVGQQPTCTVNASSADPNSNSVKCEPQPAPLKCGKYEHPEATDCNTCDPKIHICTLMNYINVPAHCAPDLHTVTEREWQELMERLKKLEKLNK